jgi:serine/threonine protein phosphatase PrpC
VSLKSVSVFQSQGARPAQEDHAIAAGDKGIFVVADGFGGPRAGADASRVACEAVRSFLVKEAGDLEATLPFVLRTYFSLVGNVLFNALIHANRKVAALNRGKDANEKGGASVLAAYLDGDLLALANVGGNSAWILRAGECAELVTPRTYGRLRDPLGVATAYEGEQDRAPLMSVGTADDLEPEIFEYRVRPGDWVILHTDGLDFTVREEVASLQRRAPDRPEAVLELLNNCNFNDNVSISFMVF